MDQAELNLEGLDCILSVSLPDYARLLGKDFSFSKCNELDLTPDKPYTARTVVPVTYRQVEVGKMTVLVLLPKDGTGSSEDDYTLDQVIISEDLRHRKKPERVVPRKKTGIIAEAYFPLLAMNYRGEIVKFAGHLDELTLDEERRIVPMFSLGQERANYLRTVNSGSDATPIIQLTVGTDREGNRFGDPHAIYYGRNLAASIQVAGFLAVKEANNPLVEALAQFEMPPQYR